MTMTLKKIGRSRYKVENHPVGDLVVFQDRYTGLWRTTYSDGYPEWAPQRKTLKEAKEFLERRCE